MGQHVAIEDITQLSQQMFSVKGSYDLSGLDLTGKVPDEDDRRLVSSTGLPRVCFQYTSFDPTHCGFRPIAPADFDQPRLFPSEGIWHLIGINFAELICVESSNSGEIWSLTRYEGGMTRFVNGSVSTMIGCLAAYIEMYTTGDPDAGIGENARLVANFKSRIQSFDPACLSDPETYWSSILQSEEEEAID